MSDERGRGGRTFTHAELDAHVVSLYGVGGVYQLLAQLVEQHERLRCVGEATGDTPPWAPLDVA